MCSASVPQPQPASTTLSPGLQPQLAADVIHLGDLRLIERRRPASGSRRRCRPWCCRATARRTRCRCRNGDGCCRASRPGVLLCGRCSAGGAAQQRRRARRLAGAIHRLQQPRPGHPRWSRGRRCRRRRSAAHGSTRIDSSVPRLAKVTRRDRAPRGRPRGRRRAPQAPAAGSPSAACSRDNSQRSKPLPRASVCGGSSGPTPASVRRSGAALRGGGQALLAGVHGSPFTRLREGLI